MANGVTRIYLVRHGETDLNREGVYQGTIDTPLNANGVLQAQALARRLADVSFDAAYSSPLLRARATAGHIIGTRPHTLQIVDAFREFSYGTWQGMSVTDRARNDADLEQRWQSAPWDVRFPDGESLHDLRARVTNAWDNIVSHRKGETLLVSAHGHVNRVILLHALQWERDRFWRIEQPNAACTRITIDATETRCDSLDVIDMSHA